jgi:hypothetical protein
MLWFAVTRWMVSSFVYTVCRCWIIRNGIFSRSDKLLYAIIFSCWAITCEVVVGKKRDYSTR